MATIDERQENGDKAAVRVSGGRWLEDVGPFGWYVRYEVRGDYWMDFWAYEPCARDVGEGWEGGPATGTRHFQKKDGAGGEGTLDLAEAECMSGFVKWDGCCEVRWREGQEHFCGRSSLGDFGRALLAIHDLAAGLIPAFDKGVAG
jgi:hypothetical protein